MAGAQLAEAAPFRQFVLKVHSRCDLACDHCYMYEAADQGWLAQPRVMSRETAEKIGLRIAEHSLSRHVRKIRVILHGGEPLLAGVAGLRTIIAAIRAPLAAMADPPELLMHIHSNGVLLDEEFCRLFVEHGVSIGISLDGDRSANDRHRRYADGRSSHAQVLAAIALLTSNEYRHIYGGILCTVDIANDPETVYRALADTGPPQIDLLLPHATWDRPPPRPDGEARPSTPADPAYARWLLAIHELWQADGRPFGIRVFDSIRSTLRGGPPLTEALGLAPSDLLVIETDGSIEQPDSLKVAYHGAATTGLRVQDDALSAAASDPHIVARRSGTDGLADQCRICPVLESCGGGLFAHRYAASHDPDGVRAAFRNPSVYCADLFALISTMEKSLKKTGVPSMPPVEHLKLSRFDQLAAGLGDAAALEELNLGQSYIARELLADAGRTLARESAEGLQAWNLIREIDRTRPGAVAETVAHPFFRPWAEQPRRDVAPFIGYALTMAVRAHQVAELPVPAGTTDVHLPGLGRLAVRDGKASVIPDGLPGTLLAPSFTLRADSVPDVLLEDLDGARHCFQVPAADRLSAGEAALWQDGYREARRIIIDQYPDYARGLAAGLRCIVPLRSKSERHDTSDTSRWAHGAVGIKLPTDAARLALLLLHEFQHTKLWALLDACEIYETEKADGLTFHSPWRSDKRPFEGLLHGAYAHIAAVDFWRRRAGHGDIQAESEFALGRLQTWSALETIDASGLLLAPGRRLLAGMRATLAPWMRLRVCAEASLWAEQHGDRVSLEFSDPDHA